MTIYDNWYVAKCTSIMPPVPFMDGKTFYLPVDTVFLEESQMYSYNEYRFNLPINYKIPEEISEQLAYATDKFSLKSEKLEEESKLLTNAGVMQVKAYCAETSNPPMANAGVFSSGVDEWKPNTEYKLNDLFSYNGNMGYVKQGTLTSLDIHLPFSEGTEALYGARPKPDTDGIYPYVYNMGIFEGMRVKGNDGFIYKSISGTYENPMELLYPPEEAPSLFVKEGEETNPDEEYKEWIQPTGAHDAYGIGAKVTHNGEKWISNTANNTWEPGVFGWDKVIE